MAQIGVSPLVISMILNHVSARQATITTKVYVQYSYDREKKEALYALGSRVQAILAGRDRELEYFVPSRGTLPYA